MLRVRRHTRCVEEERDRVEECTLCIAGRGGVACQAARLQIFVVTLSRLLLLVVDLDLWRTQEGT